MKIFTHRHLWDIPHSRFVRKGDIEKEKKEKKNGKHSAHVPYPGDVRQLLRDKRKNKG